MANTITISGRFMTITGLDADWNIATDLAFFYPVGIRVRSIAFHPGATSDRMIVHEGSNTGPKSYDFTAKGYDDNDVQRYSGGNSSGELMYPYIKISDCTLSAGTLANCSVTFELA